MRLPAPRLYIHHTVTEEYINEPIIGMRVIQNIAFSREFLDISYSWLIFKDGTIGEGRGWGVVGAHTVGFNSSSHAFSLVGNYDTTQPSGAQIDSIRYLWKEGQRLGKIGKTTPMPTGGHKDTGYATACPGRFAYAQLYNMRAPYTEQEDDLTAEEHAMLAAAANRTFNFEQWISGPNAMKSPLADLIRRIRDEDDS